MQYQKQEKYLVIKKRSCRLDMTLTEEKDFSRLDEYINSIFQYFLPVISQRVIIWYSNDFLG